MQQRKRRLRGIVAQGPLTRTWLGLSHWSAHERMALAGHWAEVAERWTVARQARGVRELVVAQLDLLPETRARLHLDHRERVALLRGLWADLRAA